MDGVTKEILEVFQTPIKDPVLVFAFILLIVLISPILLKRIRLPGIIGLIISGVVIGPHGLGLLERSAAVDLFSTIGLLFIMFIAGLELDLGDFRNYRNRSLVFGILTFLIPIAMGFPVVYYLLGYPLRTSVLVASMFATHTLISYPIINRLGISKMSVVAVTVGGTIFTDTAVLLILAMITGTTDIESSGAFWIRLGISITLFLTIVFLVVPRISAWFFRRLEDEKHAHFIFVLLILFLCALLAKLSGLEPIIGAFAAGLALNKLVPHTSSLMNRIEFMGNALFIPIFLLSVGMIIDLSVLTHGPDALLVAGALTVVALIGKWMAAHVTGLAFSLSSTHRNLIFGLSSSHAAATLAIILVGYRMNIIDDAILNGTIILILITCLASSLITEYYGKKIVLETNIAETHAEREQLQRILVPIANPASMERLMDFAIIIKDVASPHPIAALSIVDDNEQASARLAQARKQLEKVIVHASAVDHKVEILTTVDQNITNGIKRVALEKSITEIIMGYPARSHFSDVLFGKTFLSVVNQTSQNIYITRFTLPINLHTRLHMVCPPFVEREDTFEKWLSTLMRLASQLDLPVSLHSTAETHDRVSAQMKSMKAVRSFAFEPCTTVNDPESWKEKVRPNDIIALVSSRKGALSYHSYLEVLPKRLVRLFPDNSLVFVYPEMNPEAGERYTV